MKMKLSTMREWSWFWEQVRARTPRHLDLYGKELWISSPAGSDPVRLHLLELGPERAEQTLVLIHGMSGSSTSFQPLLPLARRHRVLAFDLRGHGRSSRPAAGYTVAQMADDVAAALDALGYDDPVIVVGNSAGGFVATEFALRYPERVSRVVLIASPVALREERLPRLMRGFMNLPDGVFRLIEAFPGLVPSGTSYHLGIKRFYQDMVRWDGTQKFPRLRQPALVVTGFLDNLLGPTDFTEVAELIPRSELVNVGAADHMLPFERPQAVLRAVEHFVEPDPSARFAPRWRSENDDVDGRRLLAERPWVARYDQGVPRTLDIPPVPLTRLLDAAAYRFGKRPALRYGGRTIAYGELAEEVNRFAAALQARGIGRGDRVLLALPNRPQWVVAFLGTLRLGAIAVPAPPVGPVEALGEQARQTGARVLVTMETDAGTAREVMAASQVELLVACDEADYARKRSRREGQPSREAPGGAEVAWTALMAGRPPGVVADGAAAADTAAILFTAGSSGETTGVRLTHRSLVANALQIGAWLPGIRPGHDSILSAVPFGHAYGLAVGVNAAMYLAATLVLPPDFGVESVLRQVRRERPGVLVAAPHLYTELADVPNVLGYFGRKPPLCLNGAAPLPVEARETFERLTHARVIEGYERSEIGQLALNPLHAGRTGAAGLPLPGADARILDLNSGGALPAGAIGELVVRGPQVMAGYWSEGASARRLDPEGWLHTGELACMDDDGYLRILGRRDDVWRTSAGEAVYPRDVEETIYELPEVDEVAVVAVENVPVAFVRPERPEQLTAEAVLEFCRQRLPPGHRPLAVIFVDDFPRNPVGRIVREALSGRYAAQLEALAAGVTLAGEAEPAT